MSPGPPPDRVPEVLRFADGGRCTSGADPAHRPPRHRRRRRRLPLWATIIGWVVVVPLLVVAAMRIFAWDRFEFFAIVNDLALFVYLPAWIVAVVALIGRRFVLAGAAIVVVVAQVVLVLPEWTAAQPVPGWAADAPSIRLFDANVYYDNASMSGYASEIKQYHGPSS